MKVVVSSKEKIVLGIVLSIFAYFSIILLVNHLRFNVRYMICGVGYRDCFTEAKYKDMESCQREVEMGDWLCDETDSNNIKCHVSVNSAAVAYCKE